MWGGGGTVLAALASDGIRGCSDSRLPTSKLSGAQRRRPLGSKAGSLVTKAAITGSRIPTHVG